MSDHLAKMHRGWLRPYLLALDVVQVPEEGYEGHGRWAYWLDACWRGVVPEGPIPQLKFTMWPNPDAVKHIKEVLDVYRAKGYWYDDAWLALVRWLLHGFGRPGLDQDIENIPPDVRSKWYELFDLSWLLRRPAVDWSAHILQGGPRWMNQNGARWAKSTGFFSTPMNVCVMMTQMVFSGADPEVTKVQTVCDPCVGTGSMLLPASNHSLRLFGADIVWDLCLCAELNGWLWAPWLVYMPRHMDLVLEAARLGEPVENVQSMAWGSGVQQQDSLAAPLPGVRWETDPTKVEAVQAYRAGELDQAELFARLGAVEESLAEE